MKKKHDFSVIILLAVFFLGLSLLLYPMLANYWNQRTQSRVIASYEKALTGSAPETYDEQFQEAEAYNRRLLDCENPFSRYDEVPGYADALNLMGTGVMGYITIDKIHVELPIYHGTVEAVLDTSAGHLEGSSLPVGGESTHCVLSAHRGLPSAKLFTDLDKLAVGDVFTLTILNRVLTYEVDQIRIVKPNEVSDLAITEGMDYCTLLTCTPYGINTHRLLVRGVRRENIAQKPEIFIENAAYRVDTMLVTTVIAAPMLLALLVILLVRHRKKKG